MNRALVTGSGGLVGFAACCHLLDNDWQVTGIDNNRRKFFFGSKASTSSTVFQLQGHPYYEHTSVDIRSPEIPRIFQRGFDLVIHCAAQPSHDWAASNIQEDFTINAVGTLNLLQAWKDNCPSAPFIHVSTSKVYGDNPNSLPVTELETRYELEHGVDNKYWLGIPEDFSVDNCLHSFFGVSKLSGDLLAQEFGRYFGLPVGIFRPGCITGSNHKAVELHGFLQYMASCVATGKEYKIIGYKGKQVRCNVHADDLVAAFMLYANNPKPGMTFNIGGRGLDCSLLEALRFFEERFGKEADTTYVDTLRIGDHRWWISDRSKAEKELGWHPKRFITDVLEELAVAQIKDLASSVS